MGKVILRTLQNLFPKIMCQCVLCGYETVHCLTKSKDMYFCGCGTGIPVEIKEQ